MLRRLLLIAALTTVGFVVCRAAAAQLKYRLLSKDAIMARLSDARVKNSDRVTELEKMFRDAGCQATEEKVKRLHQPNVLCLMPGADIEVDGSFMGNTPSVIELTPGDHVVTVKKSGYKPWERKLKVTGGEIHLSAELEKL